MQEVREVVSVKEIGYKRVVSKEGEKWRMIASFANLKILKH